eukprot:15059022-Ditylum_brightwellii.AAC.1
MKEIKTEEREEEQEPTWCPEQQIYIGGVVPDHVKVQQFISSNKGSLCIFGYRSLCWNPGDPSLAKSEDNVTMALGRAVEWKQ